MSSVWQVLKTIIVAKVQTVKQQILVKNTKEKWVLLRLGKPVWSGLIPHIPLMRESLYYISCSPCKKNASLVTQRTYQISVSVWPILYKVRLGNATCAIYNLCYITSNCFSFMIQHFAKYCAPHIFLFKRSKIEFINWPTLLLWTC